MLVLLILGMLIAVGEGAKDFGSHDNDFRDHDSGDHNNNWLPPSWAFGSGYTPADYYYPGMWGYGYSPFAYYSYQGKTYNPYSNYYSYQYPYRYSYPYNYYDNDLWSW